VAGGRERVDRATSRITFRTTTVPKKLFSANRGFVTVNDGPAMVSQLARYLTRCEARHRASDSEIPGRQDNAAQRAAMGMGSH
jgi:hypothetical protein